MNYQEAIKALQLKGGIEITGNPRKVAEFFNGVDVAVSAMNELQLYKDGKLCLIPESVYSKQCTELDAYKQIGTLEEVQEALEKAEKYHWHDLMENPDDLPSGRNMCTCFAEGDFVIEDGSVVHGKYPVIIPFPFSEYEYRCNFKVVAWREIEPFEREVEE